MRYTLLAIISFITVDLGLAQDTPDPFEKYPVFEECENTAMAQLPQCFDDALVSHIIAGFKEPEVIAEDDYSGEAVVLFEVNDKGYFEILTIDAVYPELKDEITRVFDHLPQVRPAMYNGRKTYMQFSLPIKIPIRDNLEQATQPEKVADLAQEANAMKREYDSIKTTGYKLNEYTSQIYIPFSHQLYSRFDKNMNLVGTNSHTAFKPFTYAYVNKYYDLKGENAKLMKDKESWFGRKLWNERMVTLQGEDYWFTLDPAADLQLGFETADNEDQDFTYNNTRAIIFQGGIGKKLSFYTTFYESQGTFPGYFNRYARSIRPDGGNPVVIPGRGVAEEANAGDFDYPVAEAHLSYTFDEHFNVQFGHGKNFIGDGYRSLLLSDAASPYPFFKLNTTFWKFKYTNTWMSLRDVRPEVVAEGSFRTKYMANHYLSVNVTKRLNLGFFENVIWENDNDRGFDINYLNPIIFYRAIEFSTGSRGGNALIGLSAKYKFSDQFNAYSQVVIDEFSTGAVFGNDHSYKNKQGFQLGFKYYDAFKVPNLTLQMEYNQVRPYVYSNNEIQLNYGHVNQSMGHLWGANFREFITIARYQNDRWYGTGKVIYGERGFEKGDINDVYYGGSIYGNDENRPSDNGILLGQGNRTNTFLGQLELGYLVNPATNLKFYTSILYRDNRPEFNDPVNLQENTVWVNFGFRTDLFNWYYDF
ncbi:MAG: gliding motility protein RemB [Cytophagaceae bacterium]|nr:gliding motility protein RemB [Cytophagaceae bacterium]|tara:strand:+ start:1506 stop:3608 length:2103 start_codon:yes stop_codon:yes gene_type:complete